MSVETIVACKACGYTLHPPPPPKRHIICPNCQHRIDLSPYRERQAAGLSTVSAHERQQTGVKPPPQSVKHQRGDEDDTALRLATEESLQSFRHESIKNANNEFDEELNLAIARSLQDEEDRKAKNGKPPRFPSLVPPLDLDWAKGLWKPEREEQERGDEESAKALMEAEMLEQEREDEERAKALRKAEKEEQERKDEEVARALHVQLNVEATPPTSPSVAEGSPSGKPAWKKYVSFGGGKAQRRKLSPKRGLPTPPESNRRVNNSPAFTSQRPSPPQPPPPEEIDPPRPPPQPSRSKAESSSRISESAARFGAGPGATGDTCTSCGFTPILGPSFLSAVNDEVRICQSCYRSSKNTATLYEEDRLSGHQQNHIYMCYGSDADAGIAESLRAHLENEQIQPGVQVECFLDRLPLEANTIALRTLRGSALLLPILSEDSVHPLTAQGYNKKVVNKLLFILEVGLARYKLGKIGILPVLVGSFSKDGLYRTFHGFVSQFATSASVSNPLTSPATTMAGIAAIPALNVSPYEVLMKLPVILKHLHELILPRQSIPLPGNESQRALLAYAESGHVAAQCKLALNYCKGEGGFPQDFQEGARWFRKAAEQGFPIACNNLGVMYEQGKGVKVDLKVAVQWYRIGAEQNDASCQKSLGVCYLKGRGVRQDNAEAAKWMQKSAAQGDAAGQANLGVLFLEGAGVPRDYAMAVDLFRRSAQQGNAHGQRALASMLADGLGVPQDFEMAFAWFHKAAEQGDADAQRSVGACYAAGKGVERNLQKAVQWFQRAAYQGDPFAQYNLGMCYESGLGVDINMAEAQYWYHKSAAAGCAPAQGRLRIAEQQQQQQQ